MNLWLAPLDGITNYLFRNTLCRHFGGIDFFMTPFMPVQERAKLNVTNWRDLWPKNNMLRPTTPQLMGNVPAHFVDTMQLLHETYGYTSFNWNLGCPVAQVVRRRRGCGLMPDTDRVEEVVAAATQTPFQFSVKMRLGLHSPEEGLRILERLEKYPLEYIVIHPRLGEQMYDGVPDWDTLDEFCRHTRHRLIYSGDINSPADHERLRQRYPDIQDWMLGRGILADPFLAEEIRGMDTGDRKGRFLKYYQHFAAELLPMRHERGTLHNFKELWHYWRHLAGINDEQLKQLLRIDDWGTFFDTSLQMLA
ncbi:MAG: tRNA-dihydrouridine synthase family protein [Bacteroidales bacterium]|jgi:tRNA-dihydrouridine synthase|nr:tRNA-dihydrouridine synthase family protein [Bacteroidales bacterium]